MVEGCRNRSARWGPSPSCSAVYSARRSFLSVQVVFHSARHNFYSARRDFRSVRPDFRSVQPEVLSVRNDLHSVRIGIHSVQRDFRSVRTRIHAVRNDLHSVRNKFLSARAVFHSVRTEVRSVKERCSSLQPAVGSFGFRLRAFGGIQGSLGRWPFRPNGLWAPIWRRQHAHAQFAAHVPGHAQLCVLSLNGRGHL